MWIDPLSISIFDWPPPQDWLEESPHLQHKVKEKNVVEYLIYVVSDQDINWMNEYNNIYELKSSIISSIKRVKYKHKQYTIYK